MKKRLLSAFLAVMMVLTMAPVAFAADDDADSSNAASSTVVAKIGDAGYSSLADAVSNAATGSTITLQADSEGAGLWLAAADAKSITIDFATHTYTVNALVGSTGSKNQAAHFEKGNSVTLKNGTLKVADSVANAAKILIQNYANVTATDMNFDGTNLLLMTQQPVVLSNNEGTVSYTNCTVIAPSDTQRNPLAIDSSLWAGYAGADVTVTDCTVYGKLDIAKYEIVNNVYTKTEDLATRDDGTPLIRVNGGAFTDIKGAALAAANDTIIKVLEDTTADVVIPAGKTITLDLNGKKLTNVSSDTITVTNGATLTIQGEGTVDNVTNGMAAIYNNGTTTLNGGTYLRSKETGDKVTPKNSYYNILNHGNMTIKNGVTVYQDGNYSSLVVNGYFDYTGDHNKGEKNQYIENTNAADPTLTIQGGTFSGGINTLKNDDHGNMTISAGTVTNYTQAALLNHNIATISGGSFEADTLYSILNCGCDATHDLGKLTVTGGTFKGALDVYGGNSDVAISGGQFEGAIYKATNGNDKLSISGGDFSTDPSAYLATSDTEGKKYVAGAINESPYFFRVALVDNDQIPVVPAVGETAAPNADDLKKAGMTEEVANVVAVAAQEVAAGDTEIKEAVAPIATSITDAQAEKYQQDAADIVDDVEKIEVRAYLEVSPKSYDAAKAYTLDITPKYDVVVVGTDKDGGSAEKVVATSTLNVTKATEVSVQLPAGFISDESTPLYVQHKGHEYDPTVKVDSNNVFTATFTNPHGFSEFTISTNTKTVAKIGNDKYTSFADAVNAVPANGTIEITGGTSPYTGTANKTFTVKNSTTADITVNGQTIEPTKSYTFKYTSSSGGSSSGKTTFKVITSSVNNGGVNASPSSAEKGATITITLSPDKGYKLGSLTVTDGSGKTIATTKKSDTVYTFTMPASQVKVGVTYVKADTTVTPSTGFNDVASGDWFADAVKYVVDKGMMNGTGTNTFAPKANTTRGMIVTVLYRLENEPKTSAASFTDVAAGQYYANAVAWANANGIVTGYGNGKFGPNDKITREQLAAILYRYAQYKKYDVSVGENTNILSYEDVQSVSSYAMSAVQWACGAGVVTGKAGGKLDPKGNATRAEVAAMLMRFCENVAK